MKKIMFPFVIALALALSAFNTITVVSSWSIGPDYEVKFVSEDPTGIFKTMTGDIIFDESNLETAKFNISIDASSINTGNGTQNKHAVAEEWFDVANHPAITFESTGVTKNETGYDIKGMLQIKGVVKEIAFPFTFIDNTFKGSFMVKRLDYKLGPNGGGASKVIKIELTVPVMR